MAVPRRKAQYGHYPPIIPESGADDSGITVEYDIHGKLALSTDYGLVDTGNPGDGITFTSNPDGSYEISVNLTGGAGITIVDPADGSVRVDADSSYFDANYLRNDGDAGVGNYSFTGDVSVIGGVEIQGVSPTIWLNDTDENHHWLHSNGTSFYVLTDYGAGGGSLEGGWVSPYPLQLRDDLNEGYLYGDKIWHAGNDGTGSGLDADKLHGLTPDTAETANTIVARDGSADMHARLFRATYAEQTSIANASDMCFRNNNSSDNFMRFCDQEGVGNYVSNGLSWCRASRNSYQSFGNGATTLITYNLENYDRKSEFLTASGRFTCQNAGVYFCAAVLTFASNSWGIGRVAQMALYRNGSSYCIGPRQTSAYTHACYMSVGVQTLVYLTAGQYIDFRGYHSFGATINSHNNSQYNYCAIARIA